MVSDNALRRAVQTNVGDGGEPMSQLRIQIVEVVEAAAEEEVLADVTVGSLDLALGLCPVRAAGTRRKAVMLGQRDQLGVVDVLAET